MARILYGVEEKDYVEITKDGDYISIIISSKDPEDKLKTIISSVQLTREEFLSLVKDV